ncbi:hypothetical protein [uncultured Imperialibacter sp.]|uniref:hypothetical protein n=1 Tax=uncultured Imperialibacter sp. TaxID=1672639 RepID=UPI0030D9E17B|tara:strand:+ start:2526 stop:2849 length:324 start_codon:yes stop_codon:yes gene_type:complete
MNHLFQLVFLALLITSCQKEEQFPGDAITSEGTLLWFGSPAVDGCGLVLKVGSVQYFIGSEQNQLITFTEADTEGIAVKATYRITGEERTSWGCTTTPIEVVSIERK